ncbi:MAG: rubrerythrin family protein, partial [Geminicoccaceae bacterium]|nr:rubrerythrin family protein [Geminicoccaceae bacterium]
MISLFPLPRFGGKRRFDQLSEQEILALAISAEEEDGRIYALYAQKLQDAYPASAAVFIGMAEEENRHRHRLIELYRKRFGELILPIRREHVADFYSRKPVWLVENLGLERIREEAQAMERQAHAFYVAAAGRTADAETRKLLGDLAAAEAGHVRKAGDLEARHLDDDTRGEEDSAARRQFILTWVQPGLAGLMDGSVSTLA